jgi:hypothetical protein
VEGTLGLGRIEQLFDTWDNITATPRRPVIRNLAAEERLTVSSCDRASVSGAGRLLRPMYVRFPKPSKSRPRWRGLHRRPKARRRFYPEATVIARAFVKACGLNVTKSPENIAEDYSEGVGIELDEEAVRRYRAA